MKFLPQVLPKAAWRALYLLVLFELMFSAGCSREKVQNDVLIQVNQLVISLTEYDQSVRMAKEEAFPGGGQIDPEMLGDLHLRVLNQLSEELLLGAYAADHGIAVSPLELDAAVAAIKADYPDDTFEETLLENAVSFPLWQRRLKARLLSEKVIQQALVDRVDITSEDVTDYYQTHFPQGIPATEDSDDIHQRIVTHLRRQKGEAAYQAWIADLGEQYSVVINQSVWESWMARTQ